MSHDGVVQSIIFSKKMWDEASAKKWLKTNGYTRNFHGKGTDETEQSYRFRQANPLTKSEQAKGYYYTTEHPKGKHKGLAFVMIYKDHDVKEHKSDPKPSHIKGRAVMDLGDQLVVQRSQGMFNMPMEYNSSIGMITDGDPLRHTYHITGHHPTLETARSIDTELYRNLFIQNY